MTMFEKVTDTIAFVHNESSDPILLDVQSALDLIASTWSESGCTKLILRKEDVAEEFFDLRTQIAGEILQKFVTYGFQIAILGSFEGYTSKSLQDFIYESNQGRAVYFASSMEDAVARLAL